MELSYETLGIAVQLKKHLRILRKKTKQELKIIITEDVLTFESEDLKEAIKINYKD